MGYNLSREYFFMKLFLLNRISPGMLTLSSVKPDFPDGETRTKTEPARLGGALHVISSELCHSAGTILPPNLQYT